MKPKEVHKIYEEDKYLKRNQKIFLWWIAELLAVSINELEEANKKIEREMISVDLYKIQRVILRRLKRLK